MAVLIAIWVIHVISNNCFNFRSCIYKNENTGQQYWSKMQHIEPVPRFAHQLVYDHVRKVKCQLILEIGGEVG